MPALVALDDTLGAYFVGLILSTVIYGVTCLQVYSFYVDGRSEDSRALKVFVATVILLDSVHLALLTHSLYTYLITNFGDYAAIGTIVWSLEVEVLVGYFLTALVQGFFAWRIYMFSGRSNWWIPAFIIVFSLVMFGAAIVITFGGLKIKVFAGASQNNVAVSLSLTAELVSDSFIMGGMLYYLYNGRSSFANTNRALNKVIAYTINSGALTLVFTVLTLSTYLWNTTKLVYTPFFFVLVRLYSCSFMSILNSRKTIRAQFYGAPGGGALAVGASVPGHELVFVSSSAHAQNVKSPSDV